MRPYGSLFFIADVVGRNDLAPSIEVLLLPARSAEPPQNSGSDLAISWITLPDAARVAISFSVVKIGSAFAQSFGSF